MDPKLFPVHIFGASIISSGVFIVNAEYCISLRSKATLARMQFLDICLDWILKLGTFLFFEMTNNTRFSL